MEMFGFLKDRDADRECRRLLLEHGGRLMGEPSPPRRVSLCRRNRARMATLDFGHRVCRVVLKNLRADAHLSTAGELCRVHEHVRRQSQTLAAGTPWLSDLAIDGWVAWEYIPGLILQDVLSCEHGRNGGDSDAAQVALGRTAELLAQVNRLSAAAAGLPGPPKPNSDYVEGFAKLWKDSALRRYLPAGFQRPEALLERLSDNFRQRQGDRVLVVDTQPKNIVLDCAQAPRFIDIDYANGNAAINIGHFLVSMDRLGLPRRSSSRARIDRWKRAFVACYLEHGGPAVAEDVAFFYAWTLIRVTSWHVRLRPWLGPYLRRYYGLRLAAFCRRLGQCPHSLDASNTPNLFCD
jgi:hypothetical protein